MGKALRTFSHAASLSLFVVSFFVMGLRHEKSKESYNFTGAIGGRQKEQKRKTTWRTITIHMYP